ncbi:hypothetical protein NPX13_g1618 [Xylaria arbuscula]|uniref:GH64 domain-containing protein n=1 Tax=Xylaria arbuscula TaxID=114810 RepID=A0A9W8NMA3_9PEZI|nr:hypothetical protein NPX13_g1618 [Xylaria arbuscula]
MRGLFGLAVASVATFITGSLARPLVVRPGGVNDVVITELNSINSTSKVEAVAANNPLQLEIVNNFGSDQMYLYVTGKDSNGVACMIAADGSMFYPDAGGSTTPVPIQGDIKTSLGGMGSTTTFTVPDFLISSRIWVSEGELQFFTSVDSSTGMTAIVEPSVTNKEDPSASIKWGFVEFNWENGTIYANITYVDWVGIAMGMALTLGSGETQTVKGLIAGSVQKLCDDLNTQNAADGAGWDKLCVTNMETGEAIRVLSPNLYLDVDPSWQADYYTSATRAP